MGTEPTAPPSFSARRRWLIGLNVLVGLIAALALLAMTNYLATRHYWRFQWTARQDMQLSPQSVRVLRSLTNDIKVTVFFDVHSEPELHSLVAALLKEYHYVNPRITFKTVDPTREPGGAELVLATYQLTALKDRNFVVIDCDGRSRVLYQNELADYQFEPVEGGQPNEFRKEMQAFKGEVLLTTTMFNLAYPRQFKVCFLQGHGEHDPGKTDHPHGYAKFASILREKANVQLDLLTLVTNDLPSDCQLLIIAGARLPFEEQELARIETYLKRGGRLLALLANPALGRRSGLEKTLAQWGVGVGDNAVFDRQHSPTGNDLLTAYRNDQHPITRALLSDSEDLRPRLVLPRPVGTLAAASSNPGAPRVDVLLATSSGGIEGEIRDGVPYRNPYQERPRAFPLAVAIEQGIKGVTSERGATRMVVVGDSLFLDNELIDWPANHYFAALTVNWLLDRPQILLEGLVPQPVKQHQFVLTRQQMRSVQWILLAALPGGVLLLGGLVRWRRRR